MRRSLLLICGVIIVGCLLGIISIYRMNRSPSQSKNANSNFERRATVSQNTNHETNSDAHSEVQRLRKELRRKDAMLLALKVANSNGAESVRKSAGPDDNTNPAVQGMGVLDERMYNTPTNSNKADEMKSVLQEVLETTELGETEVEALHCGGPNLCKVALKASDDKLVNESILALMNRVPKKFGASVVFQLAEGQSAVYLAESSKDLEIESAP